MHYEAAYLLAVLGSNDCPNSKDLKKIQDNFGLEADEEWLKAIGKFKNMGQWSSKLACVGGVGGVELLLSEESEDDMGFGLFDSAHLDP
ncbi:60S acidic ribosomal protein P2-like [Monodelphis domestica]|uniref:60S acidic ribosomal protein P2-like n=1 Tax=Monodelphis domestica TaxID=13616 RepID=UPI0000F2D36E|nr:60S acidic ribosomal protein P2-like [Monodelphis domestica]